MVDRGDKAMIDIDEWVETEAALCKSFGISRQTGARLHREGRWPTRTWISPRRWVYLLENINRFLADEDRKGTVDDFMRDR
jgi:hypothetical protein